MREMGVEYKSCFYCGGRLFLGKYDDAVHRFAINNPTGGDFYVWIQDNFRELK
jgi:hypothetical protein